MPTQPKPGAAYDHALLPKPLEFVADREREQVAATLEGLDGKDVS
jgi:hypothetical protein